MNNTELLGLTEAVQLAPAHSCSVTYGRCTQAVRVGWAPDEGLRAAQQGRTAPEQGLGWAVPDAAQRALGLLAAAAVETTAGAAAAGAAAHAAPASASGQPHQGGLPQPQQQPQASATDVLQPAPQPAPAAVQPAGAALDAQPPCAPADDAALPTFSAAPASQPHLRPQPQAALQDPGLRAQLPPPLPPPATAEPPPAAGSASPFSPARVHIFVGNLPPEAGDGALLDAFRAGGAAAADARVLRDPGTGRSKGFGFVGFPCAARPPRRRACQVSECAGAGRAAWVAVRARWPEAGQECGRASGQECGAPASQECGCASWASHQHGPVARWAARQLHACMCAAGRPGGCAPRRSQECAAQAIALMHGAFLGQSRLRCSWAAQKPVPPRQSPPRHRARMRRGLPGIHAPRWRALL